MECTRIGEHRKNKTKQKLTKHGKQERYEKLNLKNVYIHFAHIEKWQKTNQEFLMADYSAEMRFISVIYTLICQ